MDPIEGCVTIKSKIVRLNSGPALYLSVHLLLAAYGVVAGLPPVMYFGMFAHLPLVIRFRQGKVLLLSLLFVEGVSGCSDDCNSPSR